MNDGSELVSVFATGHDDRPVELRRRGDTRFVRKYHAGGAEVWEVASALWASPFGGGRTPPGLAEPLAWDPDALAFDSEFVEGDVLAGRGSLGRVAELPPRKRYGLASNVHQFNPLEVGVATVPAGVRQDFREPQR